MQLRFYGHEMYRPRLQEAFDHGDELQFCTFGDDVTDQQYAVRSELVTYLFRPDCGGYSHDLIARHQSHRQHLISGSMRVNQWNGQNEPQVELNIRHSAERTERDNPEDISPAAQLLGKLRAALHRQLLERATMV